MNKQLFDMDSPLKSAEVNIAVDGVVARTCIRQEFVNSFDEIIEAVYQFPLPTDAAITSFTIYINGRQFDGKVQSRSQALESYEDGIASSKRSFLLEYLGDGLYQVNAGNLPPNEKAVLELEVASLIFMKHGAWQYYLPTVIGQKYGCSTLSAESQPHSSIFADYDLNGTITLADHPNAKMLANTRLQPSEHGWRFQAKLNKTFMFSWQSSLPTNQLVTAYCETNQKHYGAALLEAPAPEQTSKQANIQMVIDCSGSMSGYAINDAKQGISEAIECLEAEDKINIIKFGSETRSLFSGLKPLTDLNRRKVYNYIDYIQADMGGTELLSALNRALDANEANGGGDILLITDAEVWNHSEILSPLTARAIVTGSRIFCIGVGSGVDGQLLEKLSTQTGGYSMLLNPQCNMDIQIENVIDQLRSPSIRAELKNDAYEWYIFPKTLFSKSTIPAFFALEELVPSEVKKPPYGEPLFSLPIASIGNSTADALIKITALKQLQYLEPEEAEQLATELQIVSDYTSYLFTDSESVEGSDGLPIRKQANQMVSYSLADTSDTCYSSAPSSPPAEAPDHLEVPAFLRRQSDDTGNINRRVMLVDNYDDEIDQILEQANIDFDRKKYQAKTHVELFWLEANGLDADIVFELGKIDLDETLLLPSLLLWLDDSRGILSKTVFTWCKTRAKKIVAESEYSEQGLKELFEEIFSNDGFC